MTERLHFHFSLSCIGEGNGNPLQCSCPENPRDRGAWWAVISGVAQSRTWLKRLSSRSRGMGWGRRGEVGSRRRAHTYIYGWFILIHTRQKPTQYYKAIIPQLKIKLKQESFKILLLILRVPEITLKWCQELKNDYGWSQHPWRIGNRVYVEQVSNPGDLDEIYIKGDQRIKCYSYRWF